MQASDRGDRTPANPRATGALTESLLIRFVQVAAGAVSGTLEPYRDPDCGCLLSTTFVGRIEGGVLVGSYVSNGGEGHMTTHGQWRVERVAAAAGSGR
jgi:hypothetical protein